MYIYSVIKIGLPKYEDLIIVIINCNNIYELKYLSINVYVYFVIADIFILYYIMTW